MIRMRKLIPALMVVSLCLGAQYAFSQVKGDFSDWNVPPPVPPGTIPKGAITNKQLAIQPPVDVPAPSLQFPANVRLTALAPVIETALDVPAPTQPAFGPLPFAVPDMPLPEVPAALAPPKPAPHDEVIEGLTEMPDVPVPDLPPAPKIPEAGTLPPSTEILKLPIMPGIIPQPDISVPTNSFPFNLWPAPAIPLNPDVTITPPVEMNNDKAKPGKHKKQ